MLFALPLHAQTSGHAEHVRVLGYFSGTAAEAVKQDVSGLTHVVYCFAHLHEREMILKNTAEAEILQTLVAKKKEYPALKVMIALGGWGGCETCSHVFATQGGRADVAASARRMMRTYGADGIDIDWESPVVGGYKDHPASDADKANFTALMRTLRDSLGNAAEISFDANSDAEGLARSYDWDSVMPNVSFVNLMTYGLPSDGRGQTGHHTALYSSAYQSESVDKGVRNLISRGVPREKMLIGAAFYAFVVVDVDSVNGGLGQSGKFSKNVTYSTLTSSYTAQHGFVSSWDSVARAPTLYNSSTRTFVTYDDPRSVAEKCRYVNDNTSAESCSGNSTEIHRTADSLM